MYLRVQVCNKVLEISWSGRGLQRRRARGHRVLTGQGRTERTTIRYGLGGAGRQSKMDRSRTGVQAATAATEAVTSGQR
jgi:hypothetical protein